MADTNPLQQKAVPTQPETVFYWYPIVSCKGRRFPLEIVLFSPFSLSLPNSRTAVAVEIAILDGEKVVGEH